jgi:hypothetical protein
VPKLLYSRPENKTPEAYRDFIMNTFRALTGRDDPDPYTPEEWAEKAAEFWGETAEKGGSGSGNYGHAGRPGRVGGSIAGRGGGSGAGGSGEGGNSEHRKSAARMASDMEGELKAIRGRDAQFVAVDGALHANNVKAIVRNAKAELGQYSNYLAGDTNNAMRDFIDHAEGILRSPELAGLQAKHVDAMMRDSVRKMVYQEIESNRVQFTDHGIRHIQGNIERQDQIYRAAMGGQGSARERLMGMFMMVNHDIGYTVPAVRVGGLAGIKASGKHPEFSDGIINGQAGQWNKGNIFTAQEYARMREIVRTHSSTKIDGSDWLGTSTRLADNLALFSKDKLPGMFEYVPGGKDMLVKLGQAAKLRDKKMFEWHRDTLYQTIDKTKMSSQLKRDLRASVADLNYLTPKFTLGVLAGEISSISRVGSKVQINVQYNQYDRVLQQYFNMGQKQTRSLLKDYGHTEFRKTTYDLGPLVQLKVSRVPKE